MYAFRPPGAFPDTCHITATASPFQQQDKIGTLPGLISKQSYLGREMVIFGKCHIPATRVRSRVVGLWAPFQFYNCRISVAMMRFASSTPTCHAQLYTDINHNTPINNNNQTSNNQQSIINIEQITTNTLHGTINTRQLATQHQPSTTTPKPAFTPTGPKEKAHWPMCK